MFELARTCDEADLSSAADTTNCSCSEAQTLIQEGALHCDDYECPTDCPVCDMCMDASC